MLLTSWNHVRGSLGYLSCLWTTHIEAACLIPQTLNILRVHEFRWVDVLSFRFHTFGCREGVVLQSWIDTVFKNCRCHKSPEHDIGVLAGL